MRIKILGGGPAGLYFAILMKNARPECDIEVWERNRPDDTFGFGVVFSDATLDTFEKYDRESYRKITENFAYWDDIEIRFKGTTHRIGGNGFCGCSRRTLLMLLQDRAAALGVQLHFQSDIKSLDEFEDADLIVACDGINSFVREGNREHFGTSIDLRPNRFTWMGSTRPLDAFTFSFRETEHGVFIAHAYQYEPGRSTWILETSADCFERSGLGALSEEESARFLEGVFAEDLAGHALITNRSTWRRFPAVRNKRATMDNVVLLGDAKSTAHFSIGSGTKLAMEDAIALFESFRATDSVPAALAHFDATRKDDVERIQHAAEVSLVWFEHVERFWEMDPRQFAFGLMTRSKSITYDNLHRRAPGFVDEVDRMFAETVAARNLPANLNKPVPPMFQPFALRDMVVENRAAVSPMCMYSAADGLIGDWHFVHYGSRAIGGAGLMFTEMVCVAPDARITPGCAGLWNEAHEAAWQRVVDFVHGSSRTKIVLQLGHAGRKGATKLMWEGMDRPLAEGAWPVMAASPIPYYPDSQIPHEVTEADMARITADFVAATKRAARIGFDMLEMHAAHGYLLASFLSPLTNRRADRFGGSLENRLRFPISVFRAMRAAWPEAKPMSVRISATDWQEGGITDAESVEIARAFAELGCDLVDVSTGQTTPESAPVYGRMFQTPYSDQIRNEAGIATMCVGNITSADQVNTILAAGRADIVALGRPHLTDPYFTLKAAAQYGVRGHQAPAQYEPGRSQLFRTAQQEVAEIEEMKLKTRPKTHNPKVVRPVR